MDAKVAPAKNSAASVNAELHGYYLEDLEIGMTAIYARTVTDADIVLFSGISGDTNPLHLSSDFADGTPFEGRVAHGMLTAGFISAVIGTKLPGPGCVYMSQSLRWNAPVRAGDSVLARVTIEEIFRDKQRLRLSTICTVGEEVVIEGEALVMAPSRGAPA